MLDHQPPHNGIIRYIIPTALQQFQEQISPDLHILGGWSRVCQEIDL
jgi:hypothetical protein